MNVVRSDVTKAWEAMGQGSSRGVSDIDIHE